MNQANTDKLSSINILNLKYTLDINMSNKIT